MSIFEGSARRSGGDRDDHFVLTGSAADARRSSRPRYWMPLDPMCERTL